MMISGNGDDLGFNPFSAVGKGVKAVGKGAIKLVRKTVCVASAIAPVGGSAPHPAAQGAAIAGKAISQSAICKPGQSKMTIELPACGFFQRIALAFGGRPACATAPAGGLRGSSLGDPGAYRSIMAAAGGTGYGKARLLRREIDTPYDQAGFGHGFGAVPPKAPAPKADAVPTVTGPAKVALIAGSAIFGIALGYGLHHARKL